MRTETEPPKRPGMAPKANLSILSMLVMVTVVLVLQEQHQQQVRESRWLEVIYKKKKGSGGVGGGWEIFIP